MKGKSTFTRAEADVIIALIKKKLESDSNTQKGIRNKIRKLGFYAKDDCGITGGYTVKDFLSVVTIEKGLSSNKTFDNPTVIKDKTPTVNKRANSDEAYILNICDEILNLKGLHQHRFDFLRGDSGTKLPVDIYYPTLKLVIEFREKQHTEEVAFFDKRITFSGISRGEQRKRYDELRRTEIPKNGLDLIEFDYSEFGHTKGKRLLRNKVEDEKIIREKLKNYIPRK